MVEWLVASTPPRFRVALGMVYGGTIGPTMVTGFRAGRYAGAAGLRTAASAAPTAAT